MFLDARDSLQLYATGIYEPTETEIVKKVVRGGDVVVDVGAHIGYYTLLLASLVGKAGRVFAFEPDPTNSAILWTNTKINAYENVTLVRSAVSSTSGVAKLYLSPSNSGDHRMHDSTDGRVTVDVSSVRLDDYFRGYQRDISFIKMDIQGAEWMALQGMQALLGRMKRIQIMTEFWPPALARSGADAAQYLSWFEGNGFRLYDVDRHKRRLELTSSHQLLTTLASGERNSTNVLCVRGDGS